MKIILILMLLVLSGCVTTYHAERRADGVETKIDIRTWREFPGGIVIHYNRETGQFDVEAGEVRSGSEAQAMRDVILGILPLIEK